MKLFTIGLIAGTAFAEPNFRPADRKLNGDETIGTNHTLTLDGTAYNNLNTIAGVKALAEAFQTQEENKLPKCEENRTHYHEALTTWNQANTEYDSCVACRAAADSDYHEAWTRWNQAKTEYDSCVAVNIATCTADAEASYVNAWAIWSACETQKSETFNNITNAQNAAVEGAASRRLDIEPRHITDALKHAKANEIDCDIEPAVPNPDQCTDAGDQCTGAGNEPAVDYSSCTPSGDDDHCSEAGNEPSKGDYEWGNDGSSIDLCDKEFSTGTCNIFNPNLQCRISGIQAVIEQLS